MELINIIYTAIMALSLFVGVVTSVISIKKSVTARKNAVAEAEAAKTDAEKAAAEAARERAEADLLANAKNFIKAAEVAFEGFDKMMKAQNSSAGAMKKDTVFTKLQAYALQNGYAFDADEWSKKIDELVEFTKSVNTKKPY